MFLFVTGRAVMRRDWAMIGLALPTAFAVFAYSFLAFSEPRYMLVVVPSLTVMFALGLPPS